jgi:hypothetical protein
MVKKKNKIIENIEVLEDFMLADLPSKILREDYFKTKKQVEVYIADHFNILKNHIHLAGTGGVVSGPALQGNVRQGPNFWEEMMLCYHEQVKPV